MELIELKQQATFELFNYFESHPDVEIKNKDVAIDAAIKELINCGYFSFDAEKQKNQTIFISNFLNYNFLIIYNRFKKEKKATEKKEGIKPTKELLKYLDQKWI